MRRLNNGEFALQGQVEEARAAQPYETVSTREGFTSHSTITQSVPVVRRGAARRV